MKQCKGIEGGNFRYWIIGLTFRLPGIVILSLFGFLLFVFQKENGYTKEFQGSAFFFSFYKISLDFRF